VSDYLKEYLIALGFRVDDATYKKFNAAIATSAKEAAGLGSVVVGAATAIGVSVEKVAEEYRNLGFVAQRTGETVSSLKNYSFAMKQIGVDAGQSQGAIESFAAAMRLNPGVKAFVQANGGTGRDTIEQLTNFVAQQKERYGESNYYIAAMNAQLAGIPEGTFLQIWNNLPKMKAAQADIKKLREEAGLAGPDVERKAEQFAGAWDHLWETLGVGKDRIGFDLMEPTEKAVVALDELIQRFNKADDASGGFLGKIVGVGTALGGTAATLSVMLGLIRAIAAAGGAGKVAAAVAGGGAIVTESGAVIPGAAGAAAAAGAGAVALPLAVGVGTVAAAYYGEKKYGPFGVPYEYSKKYLENPAANSDGVRDAAALREARIRSIAAALRIDPEIAMQVARAEGFGSFKSSIPGEQSFGDFQLHITPGGRGHAVGDQFQKETGLDPSDPANEAAMDEYALRYVKSHGWGDFHGAANNGIGRFAGINNTPLTSGPGSGGDVTVNQTNHNHIVANNAREAGETLDRSNDRAQGDLVRNFQGAAR
jgi:hypothetical protein